MPSRLQNKLKQVLYRPNKPSPARDFVIKKLSEAEKTLNSTIGGTLKKKEPKSKKSDKKDDKKDKKD